MGVILAPVVAIAARASEVEIPGLSDITSKLMTQCGISSVTLLGVCIFLALLVAKIRTAWEVDRTSLLKIIENQNASVDNLTATLSKVEGILLGFQVRKAE